MTRLRTPLLAAISTLLVTACGSTGSPSAPSGGNDGPIAATFTVSAAGISPKTATVAVGSRVTIVNTDGQAHNMNSDPHPEHTNCPAINIGIVTPGQSGTSRNLTTARSCGIHDHNDPENTIWRATIVVQ